MRTVFPARFTGQRSEFYSGVTPGAAGLAERWTYPGGTEYWAFSSGGAWLVCGREDVELTGEAL